MQHLNQSCDVISYLFYQLMQFLQINWSGWVVYSSFIFNRARIGPWGFLGYKRKTKMMAKVLRTIGYNTECDVLSDLTMKTNFDFLFLLSSVQNWWKIMLELGICKLCLSGYIVVVVISKQPMNKLYSQNNKDKQS